NIDVNAAALGSFTLTGVSDPTDAGDLESPVVTAYDTYSNVKTNYTGTVTFTSDDASASLPANYAFVGGDSGAHTFTNELQMQTVGTFYVRVNDTVQTGITGQQLNIDVNHGPAAAIVYTTQPTGPYAPGADILVDLEIQDAYGNTVTTGDDATADITLNLQSGTGALGGTLTKSASGGTVSFTATEGVYVNFSGTGKVIRATKVDTTPTGTIARTVDSNSFTINTPPAPTGIVLKAPLSSPDNVDTPTVTVSGISSGNTINVYTNSGCSSSVVGSAVAGGTSVDVTASPALSEATYNFYAEQVDTYSNVSNCSGVSVTYVLDLTNPNPATSPTLASGWVQANNTSPLFSYTASGSGDLDHYEVALGTTSGATDEVGYTPNGTNLSYTFSPSGLTECSQVYWPTVIAIDTAGNTSSQATHSSGYRVDLTDPDPVT
ncbi:hypothetical protein KDA23_00065, partial [Candidatus Saccharibacteria bacterium]|nr:hypothetical protein [Candidatus Saccharibacteria bacterium]